MYRPRKLSPNDEFIAQREIEGGYQGYGSQDEQAIIEALAAQGGQGDASIGTYPGASQIERKRAIADMLTERSVDMAPKGLTSGLSQLGTAFIARGANKRADSMEAEYLAGVKAKQDAEKAEQARLVAAALGPDASPAMLALGQADPTSTLEAVAKRDIPSAGDVIKRDTLDQTIAQDGIANEAAQWQRDNPEMSFENIAGNVEAINPRDVTDRSVIGKAPAKTPLIGSINNGQPSKKNLTPFQLKQDEIYAGTLAEWNTGGGVDSMKNLTQLVGVADQLDQVADMDARIAAGEDVPEGGRTNLTGWIIGNTPDWILAGMNPEAMDAKQLVEEVVQRNLRVILGAQFTEKEGVRLIERAYNPRLSERMNSRRLRSLVQSVEGRAQQLESLNAFVRGPGQGSSAGWDGSLATVDSILLQMDEQSGGTNSPSKAQKRWKYDPEADRLDGLE